ncbi:MAG: CocE/NonD family hydrolase, partial [Gammaproteobacteria bacterium]
MFTRRWRTSPRQYGVTVDFDVRVPVGEGVALDGDVFRPAAPGRFPALLGVHGYDKAMQSVPSMPAAMTPQNAQAEAGDPRFFARRGYAHAIVNVRGTGASEGRYSNYSPREAQDIAETIEWLAEQPW